MFTLTFMVVVESLVHIQSALFGILHPGSDQPGAMVGVWPTAMCVAGGETWTLYCGDSEGTVSVFQRSPISAAERLASAKKRSDSLTMEQ